jgi:hypothetical protein
MFLFCSTRKIKKKAALGKPSARQGPPPQDGRELPTKSRVGWPREIGPLLFPCHTFLEFN